MLKPLVLMCSLTFGACMVGEDPTEMPGPAAPSQLTIMAGEGGAHLMWKDNSIDESHFMVMRMEMTEHGAADHDHDHDHELAALATLAAGATEYHDTQLAAGVMYMYSVAAMNAAGMETESNEVMFSMP